MCSLDMQGNMKFSSGMFAVKFIPLEQLIIFTLKLKFPPEQEYSLLSAQNIRVLEELSILEGW